MNHHRNKLLTAVLGIISLIALTGMTACSHGRVDTFGHITIIDHDGYNHDGYYDDHHDWHGGWYDHDHHFHDDPHDWHR